MTASLHKYPWLFSVFCPILILISKSSNLRTNLEGVVPRVSITIGITFIFFYSFLCSPAKSKYLSPFSFFFKFYCGLPVALCGWAAKADDSFVCFGAKPDKGFLDLKSRRIRKWEGDAKEGWQRDPEESSWRLDSREASSRELAWNHGQGQSTPDTGAERRGSMGYGPARVSQDESDSSSIVEFSLVTHASVSPYMLSGMQCVAYLPLLLVNPKLCSCLFVVLFSPFPRSYSCVGKEMCVTPRTTSWSPAGRKKWLRSGMVRRLI